MSVRARSVTNYQVQLTSGTHTWIADEPPDLGDDQGPNPYQLLLGALGACTVMTVQMFARRRDWPLEEVEVTLDTHKIHARDCDDCISEPGTRVNVIDLQLFLRGDLTEQQRQRLTEIANRCPVHRTLTTETKIRTQRIDHPVS